MLSSLIDVIDVHLTGIIIFVLVINLLLAFGLSN